MEGRRMTHFLRLLRDQRGANAIEYALVAGLISIAAVAAFQNLGSGITNMYENVSNKLG
jgi:pilus assembly protein Flp/PilA